MIDFKNKIAEEISKTVNIIKMEIMHFHVLD